MQLAGGKGLKVATILEDPNVTPADMKIYATHTKSFPVKGSGFVSIEDPGTPPTILLDGISSSVYMIQVSSFAFGAMSDREWLLLLCWLPNHSFATRYLYGCTSHLIGHFSVVVTGNWSFALT